MKCAARRVPASVKKSGERGSRRRVPDDRWEDRVRTAKAQRTAEQTPEPGWLRRLLAYCWRYRRNVWLSLGASLGGMAVTALVPLVPKVIIDDVIVKHDKPLAPW